MGNVILFGFKKLLWLYEEQIVTRLAGSSNEKSCLPGRLSRKSLQDHLTQVFLFQR